MEIGVGLSLEKNSLLAAREAFNQARVNIEEKIDLAIVFSSADLSSASLLKTISDSLGDVPIIGSSGEVIISPQGIFKHGLALMLLKFPEGVHFNTAYAQDVRKRSTLAGEEIGEKLLYGFQDIPRALSIIFSDSLVEESANFIYGFQERLGRSFPVLGASPSDNLIIKSELYFNQHVLSNSCVGALWGGKLNFGLGIKHGWKPLGKPHAVTKSYNNVIETIDYLPAVKLYEAYLGHNPSQLKKELKMISTLYPLGIYIPGEEEYLLRNIISIEADGSICLQGNVPEGSTIRLMIGTKETCLTATKQAVDEAKKSLFSYPGITFKKKFALVFSSISRYMLLRREAKKEFEIIKESLGPDTAFIGLYTCAEMAPLRAISYRGQVYFHNQTIAILIIGG